MLTCAYCSRDFHDKLIDCPFCGRRLQPKLRPSGQGTLTSFKDAVDLVVRLEGILEKHGLKIEKETPLEEVCLDLMHWEYQRTGASPIKEPNEDRIRSAAAAGSLDLFHLIAASDSRGELEPFLPHLQLLNESVLAQNVPMTGDEGSNKLFELLIGLACQQALESCGTFPAGE